MVRFAATLIVLAALALTPVTAAEEPFEIPTFEPITGSGAFVGTDG